MYAVVFDFIDICYFLTPICFVWYRYVDSIWDTKIWQSRQHLTKTGTQNQNL